MNKAKPSRTEIVKQVGNMPSLPTIFYEIREAVDDPHSTSGKIGDIISKDQSLAARLLRLSNSAFYGFPRSIDTISEAVTMIGLRQVRDLALATCVIQCFEDLPPDFVTVEEFWIHNISCGIAAKLIAAETGLRDTERLFVSGLLHDIGRALMYIKLPEESLLIFNLCNERESLEHKVEPEVLGFDHSDLGACLLETWQLPKSLIEAVEHHHRPSIAMMCPKEASIVNISDFLVNGLRLGTSGEKFIPPFFDDAWSRLGLDMEALPRISEDLLQQNQDICKILLSNA